MKKAAYTLVIIFTIALALSSCKSSHRCAAYSQAQPTTVQNPS